MKLAVFFLVLAAPLTVCAEDMVLDNTGVMENPKPTWETQKQARTYQLRIPAPRGQIVDRNGSPLAQVRLSYNLAISFPTPLDWSDEKVLAFTKQQITLASGLLKRKIHISDDAILKHYRNRGILPMDIIQDLQPPELNVVNRGGIPALVLRQTYARVYPQGELAGGVIGYTGKEAPLSNRMIENGDWIFPESEGREGIEQAFDFQLRGESGKLNATYDTNGVKTSERIASPPVPGYNVVTTLDENLQRICENILKQNTKRGAIVILDPATGEVLALASWPTFNPNAFVPVLNQATFETLSKDPNRPLLPRAFRSAYPPGSAFKVIVGLAALLNQSITTQSRFDCPSSLGIGNFVFHNWKKYDVGSLNFAEALTQSCNTWFYQVGLKTGAQPIVALAQRLGLGSRTGIPLRAEESGNIPTDDYMLRVHHRRLLPGDIANISIGQGDILVTPLQMAQLMATLANGGQFHQTRLVKQIQTLDNRVVDAYPDRIQDDLHLPPDIYKALKTALVDVTEGSSGTAHRAQVPGIQVAGKTSTAQWGPKTKERTAAWFAGFLPADHPQYAFAVVSEGDPGDNTVHGSSHAAPLIGKVFRPIFQALEKEKKQEKKAEEDKSLSEENGNNKS